MPTDTPDINQTIREAALRLFAEFGFSGTSVRDIASAVGISPGHLTYHFPKKSDLFQAAIETAYGHLVGELRALAATPDLSAKSRLRLVLDRLWGLSPEERLMLRTALRELMTAPEHLGPIAKTMQMGHPVVLLGLLQECVAEGSLPAGTGIGLLPMIMGTLVFAPVMLSIANAAMGDLGLIEIALKAGRDDLYRLLGLS
jgi:AcrR family transcriptional regulator